MDQHFLKNIYYEGQDPSEYGYWWELPTAEQLENVYMTWWSLFEDWDPEHHAKVAKDKCGLDMLVGGSIGTFTNYAQLDDAMQDLHGFGWETSCAAPSDATLECWGRNDYGQASGPNGSSDTYTAVSAGNFHTCAIRTDGRLACWGQNGMGQVSGPNGSTDTYKAVGVFSFNNICALLVDGRHRCWGANGYGQVSGPNASTDIYTAVDGGQDDVCALRVDGRLACWGFDGQGRVSGPNASTDIYAAVSAGSHTCAVRTDGRLACWGFDAQGQVAGPNASVERFIAVSAGANGNGGNTCAIRADGRRRQCDSAQQRRYRGFHKCNS